MAERYGAFISYSHADARFARWLHARLETYRFPPAIDGAASAVMLQDNRLPPIFRDREELPASTSLTAEVRSALERSEALVVVCSPHAARSRWVNREIALFRELHPAGAILLALVEGEPDEAFPPALLDDAASSEPLAADFRKGADGRKLALLKLVAALAQVPLGDLMQRDAQRRMRRVMAVTVGSSVLALVMAVMTYFAIQSRNEAERQRAEAEGLIEYMVTDLRDELQEVGRIELMGTVNARIAGYYERQDDLAPDSLQRRARSLGEQGEDAELAGDLDEAKRLYTERHEETGRLLARDPDNAELKFLHAQSKNYLALLDFNRGDYDGALRWLEPTRALLKEAEGWGRDREDWVRLSALTNGNVCASLVSRDEAPLKDIGACRRAVTLNRKLVDTISQRALPVEKDRDRARYALALHDLWLALAALRAGEEQLSEAAQHRYLATVEDLLARDPDNVFWRELQVELFMRHAQLLRDRGEGAAAREFLARARSTNAGLIAFEPKNARWQYHRRELAKQIKEQE